MAASALTTQTPLTLTANLDSAAVAALKTGITGAANGITFPAYQTSLTGMTSLTITVDSTGAGTITVRY